MPVLVADPGRVKREAVDIGDPPGAVDDARGGDAPLGAGLGENHIVPAPGPLDAGDLDPGVDRDPEAFGLGAQLRGGIRIDRRQQVRQNFEDRHLAAGAGVDVAEFEGDDAAADEHDIARQRRIAEDIVRGDQMLGARDWQTPRRRAGGDHDMGGFERAVADLYGARSDEFALAVDYLDAAPGHRPGQTVGDAGNQRFFAG